MEAAERRFAVEDYAFSNFYSNFDSNVYSNFWLFFGNLREARSRLYRRRILQVNTRLKALDEIYKIYTYASFGEKNRS